MKILSDLKKHFVKLGRDLKTMTFREKLDQIPDPNIYYRTQYH